MRKKTERITIPVYFISCDGEKKNRKGAKIFGRKKRKEPSFLEGGGDGERGGDLSIDHTVLIQGEEGKETRSKSGNDGGPRERGYGSKRKYIFGVKSGFSLLLDGPLLRARNGEKS